jgi:hypothetical protein
VRRSGRRIIVPGRKAPEFRPDVPETAGGNIINPGKLLSHNAANWRRPAAARRWITIALGG